jgi:hypothetical protein
MAGNYYDRDFDPWVSGIRNIGTMIMQRPALQAQAQDRAAQAEERRQRGLLYQQEIETQRTTADKNKTETQDLIHKGQLVSNLEKFGPLAQRAIIEKRFDDPSIDNFTGAMAGLTGLNKDDIGKSLFESMSRIIARQGDLPGAAAVNDPNAAFKTTEDNATRERMNAADNATKENISNTTPWNIPPGAVAIDRTTGKRIALGNLIINPGGKLFTPDEANLTYNKEPSASGAPLPPKVSEIDAERARLARASVLNDNERGRTNAPAVIANFDRLMGTGSTNAPAMTGPPPMPADRTQLVVGAVYMTARGPARWDGQKFIKQ